MKLYDILARTHTISTEEWQGLSWPLKWLLMVRAPLIIMTLSSVTIGIILAHNHGYFYWDRAIALIIGLSMAHALNNMLNDWTDSATGIDGDNYFRTQYGVQVIEQALVTKGQFILNITGTGFIAISMALYLYLQIGMEVIYLTLAGGFFVLFYTWPLKHFALGELAVFLCWGPLIILGVFLVMSGQSSFYYEFPEVRLLSFIYGLAPTLVIIGKHMDKYEADRDKGITTLPVLIGSRSAGILCVFLLSIQWCLLVYLTIIEELWLLVLCVLSAYNLPKMISTLLGSKPPTKPPSYPSSVWPLWYSAFTFQYVRYFSAILIAVLVINIMI